MDNRILANYIFQEATPQETKQVEQWLISSSRNREELERLRERLDIATRRYRPGVFDKNRALTQIINKRPSSRLRYIRYSGIAAACLLLIGLIGLFYPRSEGKTYLCQAGEFISFYLPDSSHITLSGPATLSYRKSFNRNNREVSSTGTVFFEVRKQSGKPFTVHTSQLNIQVLGTSFQVESDDKRTEVLVKEGRVRVIPGSGSREEILTANMSAAYSEEQQGITVSGFDNNRLSWKTGVFQFDDTPLKEVVRLFNQYYTTTIILPEEYQDLRITVDFNSIDIEEALEIINETLNIRLEFQD